MNKQRETMYIKHQDFVAKHKLASEYVDMRSGHIAASIEEHDKSLPGEPEAVEDPTNHDQVWEIRVEYLARPDVHLILPQLTCAYSTHEYNNSRLLALLLGV